MNPFAIPSLRRAICTVGAALCAASGLAAPASAGVIMQSKADAATNISVGDILGQSFTAIDTEISFLGLGLADFGNPFNNPTTPPLGPITATLYGGEGFTGSVVATETLTPSALPLFVGSTNEPLTLFSFNASGLVVGDTYTFGFANAATSNVVFEFQKHGADPYTGGKSLRPHGTIFQDLTFAIIGDTPAPPCACDCPPGGVPEPASWALMILGFGGAGGALRRRRTTAAKGMGVA